MQTDHEAVSSRESSPPNYKLFPVNAVTWATVFGSPLAGGVILAVNFGRLSQAASKKRTLVLSFLGTVALFTLFFLIPEDFPIPDVAYLVPQLVAMHVLARSLQGETIDSHVSRGGALVSVWKAVGIGFVCLFGILVIFVATVIATTYLTSDPSIQVNANDEVCYSDGVTREDAVLVGRILTETEFFGDPEGTWVDLSVSDGIYTVAVYYNDDAWDDLELIEWLREVGGELAESRLGRPLIVDVRGEDLESRKVLRIE